MRDLNNGRDINVNGDFNVIDNSQSQHRLLIHCTSEELVRERPFREGNIRIEQQRKVRRLTPFYALSVALFVAAALWSAINGKTDLVSIFMGGASLFLAYQSLKATLEPNAFQTEEKNAVMEINKILRQRRHE